MSGAVLDAGKVALLSEPLSEDLARERGAASGGQEQESNLLRHRQDQRDAPY
jgi:hypothetical protein